MKNCKAAGCQRGASGYGHYCNSHRSRLKRHGDVRQRTISMGYIRPHIKELDVWLRGQVGAEKAWAIIEDHFAAMVANAETAIRCAATGPSRRPTIEACRDVVAVNKAADRRAAILLILAMIVHWQREGSGVFASHQGFLTQLSRRWRGLSSAHVVTYHGHARGRTKRVHRDANRQGAKALGEMLCEGMGRCAFSILEAQRRETEKHDQLRRKDIAYVLLNHTA